MTQHWEREDDEEKYYKIRSDNEITNEKLDTCVLRRQCYLKSVDFTDYIRSVTNITTSKEVYVLLF